MTAALGELAPTWVAARLRAGQAVDVRAGGGSMGPTIRDGDVVRIEPAAPESLVVGEVALVVDGAGRLRAHRVLRREAGGIVTAGDAVGEAEGPWRADAVLGRVVARRQADGWVRLAWRRPWLRDALFVLAVLAWALGAVGLKPPVIVIALAAAWVARMAAHRRDVGMMAAAVTLASPPAGALCRQGATVGALLGTLAVAAAAVLAGRALARAGRRRGGRVKTRPVVLAVLAALLLAAWVSRS